MICEPMRMSFRCEKPADSFQRNLTPTTLSRSRIHLLHVRALRFQCPLGVKAMRDDTKDTISDILLVAAAVLAALLSRKSP